MYSSTSSFQPETIFQFLACSMYDLRVVSTSYCQEYSHDSCIFPLFDVSYSAGVWSYPNRKKGKGWVWTWKSIYVLYAIESHKWLVLTGIWIFFFLFIWLKREEFLSGYLLLIRYLYTCILTRIPNHTFNLCLLSLWLPELCKFN